MVSETEIWAGGGVSASVPGPFPIVSRSLRPPASPAQSPFFATVKVSGWPEPDRTGRRLGRVQRKRGGALAPPPVQQARLRGRERERRATYAVCIAERAAGGGGGARAGGLADWLAGICSRRFRPVLSCSGLVLD